MLNLPSKQPEYPRPTGISEQEWNDILSWTDCSPEKQLCRAALFAAVRSNRFDDVPGLVNVIRKLDLDEKKMAIAHSQLFTQQALALHLIRVQAVVSEVLKVMFPEGWEKAAIEISRQWGDLGNPTNSKEDIKFGMKFLESNKQYLDEAGGG